MTEILTHANDATATASAARDFSRPRKRLTFTIDGELFEAAPVLPGDIYAEFVTRYNDTAATETYQQQHDLLKSALGLALMPESYDRFSARMKDKTNPIDDDQMADVILWLLEAYGLRPTKQSSPSSSGLPSPESGTSSTDAPQPQVSIPPTFQPTAS